MIFDLHNDILTANIYPTERASILNEYKCDSNIRRIVLAIWTTDLPSPTHDISRIIAKISCDEHNRFSFAIEDMHFLNRENMKSFSDFMHTHEVLYAGMTWNHENKLAGGSASTGRLTTLGKDTIRMLEDNSIIVDTAHLNKESFFDVLRHAKGKIINSHCCLNSLHEHPRNIDDQQALAIIERGGLIALTLVPAFLSKQKATILDYFSHIDYFVSKLGYQSLAVGTDFYGSSEYPHRLDSYKDFASLVDIMRSHGYNEEVIDAIMYKNAERILSKKTI